MKDTYAKGLSSLDRDQTIRDAVKLKYEKPLNPAQQFVKEVNGFFPGTFPSDEDLQRDHIEGDVNTFDNSENI